MLNVRDCLVIGTFFSFSSPLVVHLHEGCDNLGDSTREVELKFIVDLSLNFSFSEKYFCSAAHI